MMPTNTFVHFLHPLSFHLCVTHHAWTSQQIMVMCNATVDAAVCSCICLQGILASGGDDRIMMLWNINVDAPPMDRPLPPEPSKKKNKTGVPAGGWVRMRACSCE